MQLERLTVPDLTDVALASATLTYVEAVEFSADNQSVLVHVRYFDALEPGVQRSTYYVYDLESQSYTSVSAVIASGLAGTSTDYEILKASFLRGDDGWQVVCQIALKDSADSQWALIDRNELVTADVLSAEFGIDAQVGIERIKTSSDGRFIAVQTSSVMLADELSPDINDSSDIYLLDRLTQAITRVSFVGGAEVYQDTYLADLFYRDGQLQIAFVSDAAYVAPSVDVNSSAVSDQPSAQSDLYVWSASVDGNGLVAGSVSTELISVSLDGLAAGFVAFDQDDQNSQIKLTTSGVLFSSSAGDLVVDDQNGENDVFLASDQGISRLSVLAGEEVSAGGLLLDADDYGQAIYYLSEDLAFEASQDAPALVQLNRLNDETQVVDLNSPSGGFPLALLSSDDGSVVMSSVFDPTALALDEQIQLNTAENNALGLRGSVYEWSSHRLLSDVTMSLQMADGSTTVSSEPTGEFGSFTLPGRPGPNETLVLEKALTSEETGRAVSAADALATLKIAVGLNPNSNDLDISPYQYLAADVNKDGRVSAADALQVLKMAVNFDGAPEREWLFVNEQISFWREDEAGGFGRLSFDRNSVPWATVEAEVAAQDANGNVNQVAVLKGDVNASWSSTVNTQALGSAYFESLENTGVAPAEQWWVI